MNKGSWISLIIAIVASIAGAAGIVINDSKVQDKINSKK